MAVLCGHDLEFSLRASSLDESPRLLLRLPTHGAMMKQPDVLVEYIGFMTYYMGAKSKFLKWRTLPWWQRIFITGDEGVDALS